VLIVQSRGLRAPGRPFPLPEPDRTPRQPSRPAEPDGEGGTPPLPPGALPEPVDA
jgi:hypothetical protein